LSLKTKFYPYPKYLSLLKRTFTSHVYPMIDADQEDRDYDPDNEDDIEDDEILP